MLKYGWAGAHLLSKQDGPKHYQEEWGHSPHLLAGKMFVMHGEKKEGLLTLTIKLSPAMGQLLRNRYPADIVPGCSMNKDHRNPLSLADGAPGQNGSRRAAPLV